MLRTTLLIALVTFALGLGASTSEAVTGPIYGFQWLRDADGDGIVNHLDADWVRPLDGTGYQMQLGLIQPMTRTRVQNRDIYRYRYRWQNDRTGPSLNADQIRDRINQHDATYDRVRLRLKDKSCN